VNSCNACDNGTKHFSLGVFNNGNHVVYATVGLTEVAGYDSRGQVALFYILFTFVLLAGDDIFSVPWLNLEHWVVRHVLDLWWNTVRHYFIRHCRRVWSTA